MVAAVQNGRAEISVVTVLNYEKIFQKQRPKWSIAWMI